jgi:Fe-Mn family superoxide dismutase
MSATITTTTVSKHMLPPLPYEPAALEPMISRETLEYHHGRHHRAYVNKLNELIAGTSCEPLSLEEIVCAAKGPVFNNAAQVWNHNFYWNCLIPRGAGLPASLEKALTAAFGSFDDFSARFKSSAAAKFGSGWTWLVRRPDGTLAIVNTDDADNPLCRGETPLLVCDVWEHAYYIDYRNERARYIEAFWRLVNWDFVDRKLAAATA